MLVSPINEYVWQRSATEPDGGYTRFQDLDAYYSLVPFPGAGSIAPPHREFILVGYSVDRFGNAREGSSFVELHFESRETAARLLNVDADWRIINTSGVWINDEGERVFDHGLAIVYPPYDRSRLIARAQALGKAFEQDTVIVQATGYASLHKVEY